MSSVTESNTNTMGKRRRWLTLVAVLESWRTITDFKAEGLGVALEGGSTALSIECSPAGLRRTCR